MSSSAATVDMSILTLTSNDDIASKTNLRGFWHLKENSFTTISPPIKLNSVKGPSTFQPVFFNDTQPSALHKSSSLSLEALLCSVLGSVRCPDNCSPRELGIFLHQIYGSTMIKCFVLVIEHAICGICGSTHEAQLHIISYIIIQEHTINFSTHFANQIYQQKGLRVQQLSSHLLLLRCASSHP